MTIFFKPGLGGRASADPTATVAHIHHYAERGLALGGQRMLIFATALVLQAFYISVIFAMISTILIVVAEMFDNRTFAQARTLPADDPERLRKMLRRLHIGAFYGSCVVSFFALSVSFAQGGGQYLMPMFFLLGAAVFAAMNSHQLVTVLIIRLAIYGATFLAIPLLELIASGASPGHETWLNFLTSLVVLYFIADCSAIGLRYYRTSIRQLAQLKVENDRANKALAAKTEFLSTVSHELRTPLTSIRAALDMAMSGSFGPMPATSTKVLEIAQRNSHRLSALIDELLDLQKIEVGMMKFDFCDVQLAKLISDTVSDNRSYAQELDVTLTMLPVDTDISVRADPMRLEQVITNLLSNAAKFSDPGSEVTLGVIATPEIVRIQVSDRGVGIDPADHARIFDSFSQLDNTDIRKVNGTGLGLNISKRIVEAHSGKIGFEPNVGGGTVFFVELDRVEVLSQDGKDAPALRTARKG